MHTQSFFHYRFRRRMRLFFYYFFEYPLNPHPFRLKERKELKRLLSKGYSERQSWYIMNNISQGLIP